MPKAAQATDPRSLKVIAAEIRANWPRVSLFAEPALQDMEDELGEENGKITPLGGQVVANFLANAHGWRGEVAESIKAELGVIAELLND